MPIRRADDQQYTLASNATATGPAVAIKGGEYQFYVDGTAGGSTTSLQIQSPNGGWSNVVIFAGSAVAFTTLPNNQSQIDLPACNVRMATTGGSPSGLYSYLVGLG
jgi:hypothetical protein